MTNLYDAAKAHQAVREATCRAQAAMEQLQAISTQVQRTWAIVGQIQVAPELRFPGVVYLAR
jgi:hypothetical protein